MAERTPYPESGRAPAPPPPAQGESLYEEMLRYQNENNIGDENDIIGSRSRRKKKEGRPKSPPPPVDGTPSSRDRGTGRSTPTSGRRKNTTSSGRRSPMNVSPSVPSDNRKKPGIVAVDEPAIHPNSVMYHAAYDRPAPSPTPAPALTATLTAEVVEASPVGMSSSSSIDPGIPSPSGRSRTPTRFDPRQARNKSPRMDSATIIRPRAKKSEVIDALCVSAHNPTSRPIVKPMDPLSASEHNPMFFSSIDETMQSSQHVKKTRAKSPKKGLDSIGKPIMGLGNAAVGAVGAVGGAAVGAVGVVGGAAVGAVGAVGGAAVGAVGVVGGAVGGLGSAVGGVLGLSQHRDKKSKPKRFNSADNLDLDAPRAFDKSSGTRSKSPKLVARTRKNSVPDNVNAPTRKGSVLVEDMPEVSKDQVQMATPSMPVFTETKRDRGLAGTPRERGRRGGSVEPKDKPESNRRRGSVEPKDKERRRGGSVEPRDGDRRRRGSVEPKESRSRRRGGSVEPRDKRTKSRSPGPSRRDRSPTRGTPDSTKKKPAPSPNFARPNVTGRAATTGSSDAFLESPVYSHSSIRPEQVERSSSDMPPSSSQAYQRRRSTSQEQLDADLLLALELSKRDAQEQQQQSAAPPQLAQPNFQRAPPKSRPRAPSPKPPPSGAASVANNASAVSPRPSPVAAAKPPAAATRQPVGLGDHFARSDFANDASKAGTDDESSLADVLYALKISAEEEAARKRTEIAGKTMTSIQELLELEEKDRRTKGIASSDDDDDDDEEFHSSVLDLVASGISTELKPPPSTTTTTTSTGNDDGPSQKEAYERLQAEEEQRQLEMALKASEEALDTMNTSAARAPSPKDDVDSDLKMAMDLSRDELDLEGASEEDFMLQQQRAMEEFAAKKAQKQQAPLDHERGRNSLVERGTEETQRAISAGKAHIVTCRGCQAQLQAPTAYSLVFCPNCQTVSPTGM